MKEQNKEYITVAELEKILGAGSAGADKEDIAKAVAKTIQDYGEVLKWLAKEER